MAYRVFYPIEECHPGGKYFEETFDDEAKATEFMNDVQGMMFTGKQRERR